MITTSPSLRKLKGKKDFHEIKGKQQDVNNNLDPLTVRSISGPHCFPVTDPRDLGHAPTSGTVEPEVSGEQNPSED